MESVSGKRVNKFGIHWQIVRLRAKKLDNAQAKIDLVMDFMDEENSVTYEDFWRVKNWLDMTSIGYNNELLKDKFWAAQRELFRRWDFRTMRRETPLERWAFDAYPASELEELLKDLRKRGYKFQFGGNVPRDHVEFCDALNLHIHERLGTQPKKRGGCRPRKAAVAEELSEDAED